LRVIDGADVLLALAQIALGLAGFSGVVTAFGQGSEFRPEDRVRFLFLVGGAFATMVMAFVPIVLALAGLADRDVWVWSSVAWIGMALASMPLIRRGRRTIVASGHAAPTWSLLLIVLVGAISAAAQVGNIVGWPLPPGAAPYIAGLIAWLVGCGAIFIYLVLLRRSD
jgi:hypothetical protein